MTNFLNKAMKKSPLYTAITLISFSQFCLSDLNTSIILNSGDISSDDISLETINATNDLANINLGSNSTVNINWDLFNISNGEQVNFNFGGDNPSESVVINNILSDKESSIQGSITSNGHVFLINQNGFLFSENASIDTQGFLAAAYNYEYSHTENEHILTNVKDDKSDLHGGIKIEQLNVSDQAQYIAFYSPSISIGSDEAATINLGSGEAHFNTTNYAAVEISGLPIGFSLNIDAGLENKTNSLTLNENTIISMNNAKGRTSKIIITQNDINSLINSNINLPDQLSANDLEFHSAKSIEITNDQTYSTEGAIENLTIATHCGNDTCDIILDAGIYGTSLNLSLNTNKNSQVISNDSKSQFNYLGGVNGLNSLNINTSTFKIVNSIETLSFNLSGNLEIAPVNNLIDFRIESKDEITINGDILFSGETLNPNIELFTSRLELNNIQAGANNINIYTDEWIVNNSEINVAGTLELNNYSLSETNLVLNGDLRLIGDQVIFTDINITTPNNNTPSIQFGSKLSPMESILLTNVSTSENSLLGSMSFYVDGSADILIEGDYSTKEFLINNSNENFSPNIILDNHLTLNNIHTLDLGNSTVTSVQYNFIVNGDGDAESTSSIHNIDTVGFQLSNINQVNITGDYIFTTSGGIYLDSNNINISNSDNALAITSTSGDIDIKSTIEANSREISFSTETGTYKLNGVNNAKRLSLEQSSLSTATHILNQDYIASDSIDLEGLGGINTQSSHYSASSINLNETQFKVDETFSVQANESTIGTVTANNIIISGLTNETGTTYLTGDLYSQSDINFHLANIELLSDLTLSGNLNILDEKEYNDDGELRYTNADNTEGDLVANLNGTEDLLIQASNTNVYLYNFGHTSPLASLTLTSIDNNHTGNLHFVNQPIIAGTRGLSIQGDWYWNEEGSIEYITNDYNLDLSGVTINAEGTITFDTGSGDLSLGEIGSNGEVLDLIITSAGTLRLYGNIYLLEPAEGYKFDMVNAVELHTDLTLGSEELPVDVNFGDATIDGTYNLTIYGDNVTLGEIGSNEALQNLNIYTTNDLTITNDISLVGSSDINANNFHLDANFETSGLDLNINTLSNISMSPESTLSASNGSLHLYSDIGNIGLASLNAGNLVDINANTGYIYNEINDFKSNQDTSINIQAPQLTMNGKMNIGESVSSPIVINLTNDGTINAQSEGNIYIANLSGATVIGSAKVFDSSSVVDSAILDAYDQLQLSSLNANIEPSYESTLGLINHINWQAIGDDETIKKIRRPASTPNLYRTNKGWRLGY